MHGLKLSHLHKHNVCVLNFGLLAAQLASGGGEEDLEVSGAVLSLKCPITGSRVRRLGRFRLKVQQPLEVFDLDAFLPTVQRSRKWQVRF